MIDLKILTKKVTSAQKGDLKSYQWIVKSVQDIALSYAYSVLGDYYASEDATQEAFIEAYQKLPSLTQPEAFLKWFRKIVYKRCDRLMRSQKSSSFSLEYLEQLPADAINPIEYLNNKEVNAKMLKAVQSLPEKNRQIALLFYIKDFSQNEISEFLNISVQTIKNRLFSARKDLRHKLAHLVDQKISFKLPSETDEFSNQIDHFLRAVAYGNKTIVKKLLKLDPKLIHIAGIVSVPYLKRRNYTPLHYASSQGHQDLVEYLLEHGADINARFESGWSVLQLAYDQKMGDFLISKGAKLDIFTASKLGYKKELISLLNESPNLVHDRGPSGATPLHLAHNKSIAMTLLKYGADINAKDTDIKVSPLWWALWNDHPKKDVVDYLVSQNAQVDIFLACALGLTKRIKEMIKQNPSSLSQINHFGTTPLNEAVCNGHTEIIKLLIHNKVDVNQKCGNGYTALHMASKCGHLTIVKLLIKYGADINIKDQVYQQTPAEWAEYYKRKNVVQFFQSI